MTLVEVLAITALPEAAQNLVDCVKQAEDEAGRRLEPPCPGRSGPAGGESAAR